MYRISTLTVHANKQTKITKLFQVDFNIWNEMYQATENSAIKIIFMKHFPISECKALKTINHNRIKGNWQSWEMFVIWQSSNSYLCIYILFINHENINTTMKKLARDMKVIYNIIWIQNIKKVQSHHRNVNKKALHF